MNDLVRRHESEDEGYTSILLTEEPDGAPDSHTTPPEPLKRGHQQPGARSQRLDAATRTATPGVMGRQGHYPATPKTVPLVRSKMPSVRQLDEICRSCRREIRTLERCVILSTYEEKRAGDVTFKESVTKGVCCLECTPVSTGGCQA